MPRYLEIEKQVRARNWVPFSAPIFGILAIVNGVFVISKLFRMASKYDFDSKVIDKKYPQMHLYVAMCTTYLLVMCLKHRSVIHVASSSKFVLPFQIATVNCLMASAACSIILHLSLSSGALPYTHILETKLLKDILLTEYCAMIPMGFLSSYSFYLRDPAVHPFNFYIRLLISIFAALLMPLKLWAFSDDVAPTCCILSVCSLIVLYSDYLLRLQQYKNVLNYLSERNQGLNIIGLQLDLTLITNDRLSPTKTLSPLSYAMNLGEFDISKLKTGMETDFIVRETVATLNNQAIITAFKVATYAVCSWAINLIAYILNIYEIWDDYTVCIVFCLNNLLIQYLNFFVLCKRSPFQVFIISLKVDELLAMTKLTPSSEAYSVGIGRRHPNQDPSLQSPEDESLKLCEEREREEESDAPNIYLKHSESLAIQSGYIDNKTSAVANLTSERWTGGFQEEKSDTISRYPQSSELDTSFHESNDWDTQVPGLRDDSLSEEPTLTRE